ncbi:MAG TPA: phage tail tape measure protein [Williamwhitmania sp.]|nr:phage tail tape measure protein [Williamwhitmania sp.]
MAINETAKARVEIDGKDAEAEMNKLRAAAKELNAELKRTKEANDLTGWEKANAAMKENRAQQNALKIVTKDISGVMSNLSGSALADLTRAQRQLSAELKKSTQNTKEEKAAFAEKAAQLQAVNGQISKTKAQMSGMGTESQTMFGSMNDGVRKWGASIIGVVASITLLSNRLEKFRDEALAKEDAKNNLSALTGLDGENIAYLVEQADKLSTSTTDAGIRIKASSKDILDAYTLMGSAKPELLQNKEALGEVTKQALILAAAAKMETGPAVDGLASTMNQFSAGANEAGRYINVLAAGSKAGAVAIPDLTTSIIKSGTAASISGLSIEQLVGSIETIGEKGVKGELAGTNLKNVFLKLMAGADDTNPKVVGLGKALENLSNKNLDADGIIKIFGEDNYTVAQILVSNRKQVDYYTKAVTGTSVAYEQAQKNTSGMSAKLAQAKNQFSEAAQVVASKFNPIMLGATSTGTKLMQVLGMLPETLYRYGPTLLAAGAAFVAYGVAVNASIVLDKLKVLWTNNIIGSMKKLYLSLAANPWVAAAAGVAMLAAGIYELVREIKLANNPHKEFIDNLTKEKVAIGDAFDAAKRALPGSKERAAAIQLINEKYGQYLPNQLTEKSNLDEITKAQELATQALIRDIAIKSRRDELEKIGEEGAKKRTDGLKEYYKLIADKSGYAAAEQAEKEFLEITQQMSDLQAKGGRENYMKSIELANQLAGKWGETASKSKTLISVYAMNMKFEQQDLDKTKKFYDAYVDSIDKALSAKTDFSAKKPEATDPNGGNGAKGDKDAAFKALEEDYKRRKVLLDKELLTEKTTKDTHDFEMLKLDVAYYQARLATAQRYKEGVVDEEQALVNAKQAMLDKFQSLSTQEMTDIENYAKLSSSKAVDNMVQGAQAELDAQLKSWDEQDKAADDRAKKNLQLANKRAEEQKGIFEQTGAAFGELVGQQIAGQQLSAAAFGKSMLLIALDTLHGIVRMAIAQVWAGSLASPESIATWGAAGTAKAIMMSALIEAAFSVAKTVISASINQKASGDYTVIGAQDGKTYHAPYSGAAKTGYYPSPTLISEQGGEVVIDAPTVRNIRMNSPHILSSIMALRVPQHATGSYPAASGSQSDGNADLKALLLQQASLIASLNETMSKGISADISYTNLITKMNKVSAIDSKVSKK